VINFYLFLLFFLHCLLRYEPGEGPGIRLDSSCGGTGHVITPFYDSLLAKVIARGTNLFDASTKLARALDEFVIEGLRYFQFF
jgi:pyruvate carboxylase